MLEQKKKFFSQAKLMYYSQKNVRDYPNTRCFHKESSLTASSHYSYLTYNRDLSTLPHKYLSNLLTPVYHQHSDTNCHHLS